MNKNDPTSANVSISKIHGPVTACDGSWCFYPAESLSAKGPHSLRQIAKPNSTRATSGSTYNQRGRIWSCLSQWLRCKDLHARTVLRCLEGFFFLPDSGQTLARLLTLQAAPDFYCCLLLLAVPCCTLLLHSLSPTLHLSERQDVLCFFEHSRTLTRMTSHGENLHF
eukprot:s1190_g11.t1